MKIELIATDVEYGEKPVDVSGTKFMIGRAEECKLCIANAAVSRCHCMLILDESYIAVRDLGSRNGVYLNGERIECEEEIHDGDILMVGPVEFQVSIHDDSECGKDQVGTDSGIEDTSKEKSDAAVARRTPPVSSRMDSKDLKESEMDFDLADEVRDSDETYEMEASDVKLALNWNVTQQSRSSKGGAVNSSRGVSRNAVPKPGVVTENESVSNNACAPAASVSVSSVPPGTSVPSDASKPVVPKPAASPHAVQEAVPDNGSGCDFDQEDDSGATPVEGDSPPTVSTLSTPSPGDVSDTDFEVSDGAEGIEDNASTPTVMAASEPVPSPGGASDTDFEVSDEQDSFKESTSTPAISPHVPAITAPAVTMSDTSGNSVSDGELDFEQDSDGNEENEPGGAGGKGGKDALGATKLPPPTKTQSQSAETDQELAEFVARTVAIGSIRGKDGMAPERANATDVEDDTDWVLSED